MKTFGRILGICIIITVMLLCVRCAFSQSSGPTPPPPPVCGSTNAGALYTNTGTSPATVYTCSYYNLAWQWVVNPSYGGLVSYPTVPSTCSGALPVFLAGWPNTQEYVCVNGVPDAVGGYGSGVTTFAAPSASWPSWLVPTVTNPESTPSLAVAAETIPLSNGGTGATTAAEALANLGGAPLSGATFTGAISGTSASFSGTVAAGSVVPTTPIALANGGTGASTAAEALTALGADPFGAAAWNVVLSSGADNTGATVTNTQLQAALNASHNVYIPDGTYLINAVSNRNGDIGGLAPQSNTTITCSRNAILQVQTNNSTDYAIFRLAGYSATYPAAIVSNNVTIQGCNLMGDVTTHTGTTGEWGFGVSIFGASGITLRDDTFSNMWGDGIQISGNPVEGNFYPIPTSIVIDNVKSINNRRQGMSVVNVNGLKVSNSTFAGTGSIKLTAPGAGVDIEPCCGVESATNISFQNVDFTSNVENGFIVDAVLATDPVSNLTIAGGSSVGNGGAGYQLYSAGVSHVRIHDTLSQNNAGAGIFVLQTGDVIEVDHNTATGNVTVAGGNFDGTSNIVVQATTNTRINNNSARVGSNSNLPNYGVQLLAATAAQVFGNDLVGSGSLGDFNDYTGTNNSYCFNQITSGQQTCQGIAINLAGLQTKLLTGVTGSIGGSALTAGQCVSGSAAITGVVYGEVAVAQPQAWLNGAFSIYATTGTNSVNVYVCAIVAGTPTATTYSVRVIQ